MADFNILMVGGRRTGKTSVLASMLDSYQKRFAGHDIVLSSKVETSYILEDKILSLKNVFATHCFDDEFDPDIDASPNMGKVEYTFYMSIAGKSGSKYELRFTDIPGEWFVDDYKEHEMEVNQLFAECNIMIIAVDTPHLIEDENVSLGYGRFHDEFNRPAFFTNTIMDKFLVDQDAKFASDKMVLFMPLKCEKYMREGRSYIIPQAIEKGYANLIAHLKGDNFRGHCTIAVLPILTIGNFVFSRFGENASGEVVLHPTRRIPLKSLYTFPDQRSYKNGFAPEYCEQPLVYILAYILKMVRKANDSSQNGTWKERMKKLLSFFGILRMANDQQMVVALNSISSMMIKSKEKGFQIIQNAINL